MDSRFHLSMPTTKQRSETEQKIQSDGSKKPKSGMQSSARRKKPKGAQIKSPDKLNCALRYHRRTHKVGRLSAEEKAARLAQMTEDANARHRSATAKIEQAEKRDQAELDALKQRMKEMDSGRGAAQEMSAAAAGWVTKADRKLEDSIASRKYYSQNRRNEKFRR